MKTNRETPKRRVANHGRGGGTSPVHSREARAPKSVAQTGPIARPTERPTRAKNTSQAKARAKARKAKAPKVVRPRLTERLASRLASIDLRPGTLARKVPFVVLVIGALGLGLGLTLWLSTDSAERSYQLSDHRERNRVLQQQKEALERDVRQAESAPALAEAARQQGMIPTRDTAHLIQDQSGSWVVVGTPKPADGVPPPPLNTKLPDSKPQLLSPEIPVLVQPGPADPFAPARSGPEALLRTPDGSATVGGQHLPTAPIPGFPMPGLPAQGLPTPGLPVPGLPMPGLPVPGMPMPGLPVPGMQMPGLPSPGAGPVSAPVPAEVPIPLGGLSIPALVPAPLIAPAPPVLVIPPRPIAPVPVAPGPVSRAPVPPRPAPAHRGTIATPGVPR